MRVDVWLIQHSNYELRISSSIKDSLSVLYSFLGRGLNNPRKEDNIFWGRWEMTRPHVVATLLTSIMSLENGSEKGKAAQKARLELGYTWPRLLPMNRMEKARFVCDFRNGTLTQELGLGE